MDLDNIKEMAGKFFKGCGCLTVGFFVLAMIVGIFADDDEKKDQPKKPYSRQNRWRRKTPSS